MLTIERVRQLLNDPAITDETAEDIRDGFRALIEDIIFPAWLETNKHKHE